MNLKKILAAAIAALLPLLGHASMTVNTEMDVDLAGVPPLSSGKKTVRNDKLCSLVEAIAMADWTVTQQGPQPTSDCPGATQVSNDIFFDKKVQTIRISPRTSGSLAAFEINSPINLHGNNLTVIDANGLIRIFRLGTSAAKLDVVGMGLRGGTAQSGAAVLIESGGALFTCFKCIFAGNYAIGASGTSDGGAINSTAILSRNMANELVSGVEIVDSYFASNGADRGGAIFGQPVSIVNSTFFENVATRSGGALHIEGGSDRLLEITSSFFERNFANPTQSFVDVQGGAIFSNSHVRILASEFLANMALPHGIPSHGGADEGVATGGAIHLGSIDSFFGPSIIKLSGFYGNQAGYVGGKGGALNIGTNAVVAMSFFLFNKSVAGFAIHADTNALGGVKIANSTVAQNYVEYESGGAVPEQLVPLIGSVVNAGSAPLAVFNSFIYQDEDRGATLVAEAGSAIELRNSAVGAKSTVPAGACGGLVEDKGNNVQSKPSAGSACPASIVVPAYSGEFLGTLDLAPLSIKIGDSFHGRSAIQHYAVPAAGAELSMKGLGNSTVCAADPVNNETQKNQPRVGCDIGPVNL